LSRGRLRVFQLMTRGAAARLWGTVWESVSHCAVTVSRRRPSKSGTSYGCQYTSWLLVLVGKTRLYVHSAYVSSSSPTAGFKYLEFSVCLWFYCYKIFNLCTQKKIGASAHLLGAGLYGIRNQFYSFRIPTASRLFVTLFIAVF
jgi:hypothetical protein